MAVQITQRRIAEFTRPANTTAYAAGQIVSNSVSVGAAMKFADIFPAQAPTQLTRVFGQKSTNVVTLSNFILYLFNADPGTVNDATAFAPTFANRASLIGQITLPIFIAAGANIAWTELLITSGVYALVAGAGLNDLFGVLVATAAYVPGNAEQFSFSITAGPEE